MAWRLLDAAQVGGPGGVTEWRLRVEIPAIGPIGCVGWLLGLEARPVRTATFVGNCTVWKELPHMYRPGTLAEGELCRLWEIARRREAGDA